MESIDLKFKHLFSEILREGKNYENKRRGSIRKQIPSYTFRHAFENGFPAIGLKTLNFHSVVGELLWFLKGDNDIKYLRDNGINIWNKDAYNWHVKKGGQLSLKKFKELGEGSVGRNYSVQWRNYNGEVDQIANLIKDMKKDIMGSRLIVNAWNPSEVDKTALPPCHTGFQIIGVPLEDGDFGFELHWKQRSVDSFLGAPYNVASYATLAKILERLTGYKALAVQGDLKCVHLYDNQFKVAEEVIKREHECFDKVDISIVGDKLEDFNISDFKLLNYKSHGNLTVPMLAPKEI